MFLCALSAAAATASSGQRAALESHFVAVFARRHGGDASSSDALLFARDQTDTLLSSLAPDQVDRIVALLASRASTTTTTTTAGTTVTSRLRRRTKSVTLTRHDWKGRAPLLGVVE